MSPIAGSAGVASVGVAPLLDLPRTRFGRALPGATNVAPPRTISVAVHLYLAVRGLAVHPHAAVAAHTSLAGHLPSHGSNASKTGSNAGSNDPQKGASRSNPGSDSLQRRWTSTQRKTCSGHLSCTPVDLGERPRTPLAEREGFEPPGREPFRFQGGCIWPLCHRSGLESIVARTRSPPDFAVGR